MKSEWIEEDMMCSLIENQEPLELCSYLRRRRSVDESRLNRRDKFCDVVCGKGHCLVQVNTNGVQPLVFILTVT